jgi:hypothetical protein
MFRLLGVARILTAPVTMTATQSAPSWGVTAKGACGRAEYAFAPLASIGHKLAHMVVMPSTAFNPCRHNYAHLGWIINLNSPFSQ